MMQFHKVLSPIMARLGVKLVTRNMAQGGMGKTEGIRYVQAYATYTIFVRFRIICLHY